MFESAKIPPRSTWKTGCHLPDHKAIISALKETYGKKLYQSRLSRWMDRLIPFDYEVKHVPGRSLGIVDCMSRQPTFEAPHLRPMTSCSLLNQYRPFTML